jgi:hypothetical protein
MAATPEKLTADIQLPNQSHQMDPRLNTPWYAGARRMAAEAKKPPTPPTRSGGVLSSARAAVGNWRTFAAKGRR